MKSKCSFILKAGTSLVLAMLMLFGTVATSVAAVVESAGFAAADEPEYRVEAEPAVEAEPEVQESDPEPAVLTKDNTDLADTGAKVDLADTGWSTVYFIGDFNGDWSTGISGGSSGTGSVNAYLDTTTYFAVKINSTQKGPSTNGGAPNQKASTSGNSYKSNVTGLYQIKFDQNGNGDTTPWVWVEKIGSGNAYIVGDTALGLNWTVDTTAMTGTKGVGYKYTSYAASNASASTSYGYKVENNNYANQWPSSGNKSISGVTPGAKITYTFAPHSNSLSHTIEHKVTTSSGGNGTISADKSYVANGSTVKFTLSPSTGYEVDTFTINGTSYKSSLSNNTYTYTLNSNAAVSASVTYKLKTYTISYNKGTYGSGTNTSDTKTHGTALTLKGAIFTRDGYTQTGWASNTTGTTHAYNLSASYTNNSATTLYPEWTEKTSTLTVNTDGNGTLTKSGTTSGVASYVNVTAASGNSGYTFSRWNVSGTDADHVVIKNSSGAIIYSNGAWTGTNYTTQAIRVYTDGSAANLTATVQAAFVSSNRIYYVGTLLKDDAGNYTVAKATSTANTNDGFTSVNTTVGGNATSATVSIGGTAALSTHGDYSVTDTQNGVNFTYTKYKFVGWYSSASEVDSAGLSSVSTVSTSASYSPSVTASSNAYWYAVYRKYYVFSAYKSYDHAEGKLGTIIYKAAPPNRIKNGSAAAAPYTEASKVAVAAGDDIILYYSSLSSSDCIDTVYYDNTTNYTTDTPTAANFATDPPTLTSGTHYTANQSDHTVTIHATQNIKNITIALGTKYRAYLSDTDKIVVQSKNIDNFYTPSEEMSGSTTATYFTIKAKGNADQTNTISTSNIKVYRADANGQPTGSAISNSGITFAYSSGSSVANSDGTASTNYIKLNGTMPSYDVYIDLGVTVSYKLYLDSRMVSDEMEHKTKFNQVANIYMKNEAGTSNLLTQSYNSSTAAARQGASTQTKGTAVQYTYSFYGTDWPKYYMFIGWYTGTADGPDYENGFVTDKQTFKYTPKKNTYMYAVGTRDLFINGSKYITGVDNDWNRASESAAPNNLRMTFDPSLGTNGMYYWEITDDIFKKASKSYTVAGYHQYEGTYYWDNNSNMGNSWFQIMDTPDSWDRNAVWKDTGSFVTEAKDGSNNNKIKYGKIMKDNQWIEGCGFIQFNETSYPGYSSPIRIYYDPSAATKTFTVEPAYVYPNIYLSNGYTIGSTLRTAASTAVYMNGTTESTSTTYIATEGSGWDPDHEGHVTHYKVKVKDGTIRVKKTCASTEQVTAFFVYDLLTNKVHAESNVKSSGNTYYTDIKMQTGHDLYIVPIVEVKTADLTVYFDGTQLDSSRWGKIVSCYAWYSSGEAYGAFPGQPMVPSDDGTSWTAKFPSQLSDGNRLVGITFSNNVDDNHSWLGQNNVMPSVTSHADGTIDTSTSILKHKYNDLGDTADNHDYRRLNCKVQTYDYREPISYYNNYKTYNDGDDITLTFAIKDGNSDSTMSLKHSELVNTSYDLFTKGITHTHSNGTTTSNHKYTSDNFEYLTNATGKKYADLNGDEISGKPAPTFYVIAKGQVIYDNSTLKQVFWSGSRNESKTDLSVGYKTGVNTTSATVTGTYGVGGVSVNYGVQWYVYDASGKYITNMLSAGYADDVSATNKNSLIAKKLKDLGYAVDGKSVAISYDKPRWMTTDNETNGTKYINSGDSFDSYRFTGQWYRTNNVQPVTVDVKVGMMTDSGEKMEDSNSAGYGSATIMYDTTKGNAADYGSYIDPSSARTTGVASVTTALKDAENQPLKLTATESNFIGWYYYDSTGKLTQAKHTSPENFYPTYSKDTTYYALYRAAATYKYKYEGREGDQYYSVSGGDLQVTELTDNKVRTTESIRQSGGKYDITALAPGSSKVAVFKKDIDFSKLTSYSNAEDYILDISKATGTTASYTLTYYYRTTKGGSLSNTSVTKEYGKTVDLSSLNAGSMANSNEVFMGWYLYDTSKTGDARYTQLLTTQGNYGFVMVKDMTIAARYGSSAASESGWQAFIDDSEVNKELNTSTTGRYYNDTVVRYRNGVNAAEALPSGAEVGVLIINNGGDSSVSIGSPTDTQLTNIASADSMASNGSTAKIGTAGKFVTKLCKTVGTDVTPTYYNRVDFALRSDYAGTKGSSYSTYAYVKIGTTYYWSTVAATGDYTA